MSRARRSRSIARPRSRSQSMSLASPTRERVRARQPPHVLELWAVRHGQRLDGRSDVDSTNWFAHTGVKQRGVTVKRDALQAWVEKELSYDRSGAILDTWDPPLTHEGVEQAKRVAARLAPLDVQHVFVSPAFRCVQTGAEIARACGLKMKIEEAVLEPFLPSMYPRGRPRWVALQKLSKLGYPIDLDYRSLATLKAHESFPHYLERSDALLAHLRDKYPGRVVLVGHHYTVPLLPSMLAHAGQMSTNCALSHIKVDEKGCFDIDCSNTHLFSDTTTTTTTTAEPEVLVEAAGRADTPEHVETHNEPEAPPVEAERPLRHARSASLPASRAHASADKASAEHRDEQLLLDALCGAWDARRAVVVDGDKRAVLWHDGSCGAHHAMQMVSGARPCVVNGAVLRFTDAQRLECGDLAAQACAHLSVVAAFRGTGCVVEAAGWRVSCTADAGVRVEGTGEQGGVRACVPLPASASGPHVVWVTCTRDELVVRVGKDEEARASLGGGERVWGRIVLGGGGGAGTHMDLHGLWLADTVLGAGDVQMLAEWVGA